MDKTEWQSAANYAARKALRYMRGSFLSEQLLVAVLKYVPDPSDKRQFGPVVQKLARDGQICRAGYGRAKSSHNSPKPRWANLAYRNR